MMEDKSGYAIFTFTMPYTDNIETVLFKYNSYDCEFNSEGHYIVKFSGLSVVDKKHGDFVVFEEDKWYPRGLSNMLGVYEIPLERFLENSCYGVKDKTAARLLFEVYET
jgi:hypothetical protein